MYDLFIKGEEFWDATKEEFIYTDDTVLTIEHSLKAISEWESIHEKSFLDVRDKSHDEIVDYIKCMTISNSGDADVYRFLGTNHIAEVTKYMEKPMSATRFSDRSNSRRFSRELVTSETVYFWMTQFGIPFVPCETWNFNKLMALIRMCEIKSTPGQKMPRDMILRNNAELNAVRRAKYHTKG